MYPSGEVVEWKLPDPRYTKFPTQGMMLDMQATYTVHIIETAGRSLLFFFAFKRVSQGLTGFENMRPYSSPFRNAALKVLK